MSIRFMSIRFMSIRLTFAVAAAIATLGLGSTAFAQGYDNDSGNRRPSYYTANGAWHLGRPHQEQALTPTQQNDWWRSGTARDAAELAHQIGPGVCQ